MVFDAFAVALGHVFALRTFAFLVTGVIYGGLVGILPGFGGAAAVALLLPFTFSLSPIDAFALLMGTLAVTSTTGDLTSILLGVPGEATAAATVVDGHPMARNGEGGRALGISLMSSLIGTLVGAFVLAITVPAAAPLMKVLGSPELFMLSLLGITFMVPLVGTNPLKGLIAGGLGLLLATVGIDPIEATPRFTLGTQFLWDGIGLLPVTLGLLALPEALTLGRSAQTVRPTGSRLSGAFGGMKESLGHWRLVIRCSALGTAIGLLPGIGASVAQWVAYGHAAQGSSDKSRFGKGAVEGILAPSAANNATLGGALVPTLAFGVPGSVSTAVLLGALALKGIVPGPQMLIPESQGGQLTFVFSLVWFMVVANCIAVAISALALNHLAKITMIRGALLVPFILFLICLGAFSERQTVEDFLVLALLGALGFLMVHLNWPRAPLLLGLVLGPLAENRLFLSTAVHGLDWLSRPGVILIFAAIMVGLTRPLSRFQKRRDPAADDADPGLEGSATHPLLETIFSCGIVIILAAALWQTQTFPPRAALFPRVVLVFTLALALCHVGRLFIRAFANRGNRAQTAHAEKSLAAEAFAVFVWFIGFLLMIWLFGFVIGAPLSIFLYLALAARESWGRSLVLATPAFVFVYVVMDRALNVPFPASAFLQGW